LKLGGLFFKIHLKVVLMLYSSYPNVHLTFLFAFLVVLGS
jgi:hypothetical protein